MPRHPSSTLSPPYSYALRGRGARGSLALRETLGGRGELYVHGGAHLVPTCSGEFKRVLTAFVDSHGGRRRGGAGEPAAAAADGAAAAACGG